MWNGGLVLLTAKYSVQRIDGDWCVSILRYSLTYCVCYKRSVSFSEHHIIRAAVTEKMEKRCRPPQGYYKNLETFVVSRARMCDRKPEVLGVYDAETSNARGNGVTNTIACGFLQLVSNIIREMLAWRTSKAMLGCPRTSRQCQSASPFIWRRNFGSQEST